MRKSTGATVGLASLMALAAVCVATPTWATEGEPRDRARVDVVDIRASLPDHGALAAPRASRRADAAVGVHAPRVADSALPAVRRACSPGACDGFPVIVGIRF